jgi:hypothetical protein
VANTRFTSADDGLGAVNHLEFAEDVGAVATHRFLADVQFLGDFTVPGSL